MDSSNTTSPLHNKYLRIAAILLMIALVVAVFVRLMGSTDTDAAESASASGAQSSMDEEQSDGPQSVAKTITPQSGGPANASGSLATDAEAAGQASFVMNTVWAAYSDPEQARATDLSSVLTGSALEEFDVQALEWTRDGTHATGVPTVEDAHILSDDGTGTIKVSACIDSSNVRVLNDAGTALSDDTTMTRALTYFHFVRDGQTWKLSGFSFPDDPTC